MGVADMFNESFPGMALSVQTSRSPDSTLSRKLKFSVWS